MSWVSRVDLLEAAIYCTGEHCVPCVCVRMRGGWQGASADACILSSHCCAGHLGTFLVRPSKSHKGFTLSVRFDETRHVMIMERGGQYGFSEPCTFNSVLEIVEFFQRESLACYNAELETKLLYPYTTAPIAEAIGPAEEDEDEDEDLYVTNRQALRMQRHRREDGVQIKLHDYGDTYEEVGSAPTRPLVSHGCWLLMWQHLPSHY